MNDLTDDRDPFEAVAESFLARHRAGERPGIEEYAARHPECADQIRRLLPAMLMAQQAIWTEVDAGVVNNSLKLPEAHPLLPVALEEYENACAAGTPPSPSEFIRKYPAIASELAACLVGFDRIRTAAGSFQPGRSALPARLGDYRILGEIGRGGMGVVYEAEQISLGRRVALKVLPHQVARDPMALERFRREAKAAARLHHTNIVPVFEVGRVGDVAFYAMQFIEGQGLDRVVNELVRMRARRGMDRNEGRPGANPSTQPMTRDVTRLAESLLAGPSRAEVEFAARGGDAPSADAVAFDLVDPDATLDGVDEIDEIPEPRRVLPLSVTSSGPVLPGGASITSIESAGRRPFYRSVAQIGRQAAQGLAYAHARGIVHRDVKPSNLLLDVAGVVWIADFGLAKVDDDGLTATGDLLGTLRYMAPERFRGGGDARADVYALGLTLYELLTLRPAYDSMDRFKLVERIKNEEPARPRSIDARIPRDLETIVLKAIEKDPGGRYATAALMAEDLRRFLADEPVLARPAGVWERYWRWARRNPAVAILGAVLTGVLLLATVGSLLAAERFRRQAETQRGLAADELAARLKTNQANARLNAAQEELRQTVYATRSNLAMAAYDANDIGRSGKILDLMRPSPGEPDRRGWEWRYLWRLGHEYRLTLGVGSKEQFIRVAFSPDGEILAGLEGRGRLQLWDRRSGRLLRTTGVVSEGRTADLGGGVGALVFSPDGRSLVGQGPDRCLALFDVGDGRLIRPFEGRPIAVLGLTWHPHRDALYAALSTHVVRVLNAGDGRVENQIGGHAGPIAAVAVSPDGRILATAGYDRRVTLWPLDGVGTSRRLEGHTDEVHAVAFSPDGRRVASAGLDRTVRIWDVESGSQLSVIRGHDGMVGSLSFLPDGVRIATASADRTVRVWDAGTEQEIRRFQGPDRLEGLAVSPDGREIAAAAGGSVEVWDVEAPPNPHTLRSPSLLTYGGAGECIAFSPDGALLVTGHGDHALRVWDFPSRKLLRVVKGHDGPIKRVAFSPDGRIIAAGDDRKMMRLWDAATGESRGAFPEQAGRIAGLVFSLDGRTLFSADSSKTITAWDFATRQPLYTLDGHVDDIFDLAVSPDGRTLASASGDDTCIVWDLVERRPRATLRGHANVVDTVAFSPDGKIVATASSDRTVRLWDAADGSPRGVLEGHVDALESLAFNPDGRLASSSADQTIRIWDVPSRQTVLILKGHTDRIPEIRFSPDGGALVSASDDRTIKIWQAAPPEVLAIPGG
ncbi:protein kinase domain-containing protein [Paludisphaera rhizosphaerae]|uniref:protein kinase domain-containing protein n=1 Tax=Paludisphaera rhizosphaerae TaxID=2711216 RepID=UPI0013ED7DC5|nr:protein kinase [Paludisphaera rhizosphaerae]